MKKTSGKPKNSEEFDKYFEGHDIADLLITKPIRINLDLPAPVLARLDSRASRLGLTRQAIIKYWIAENLQMVR